MLPRLSSVLASRLPTTLSFAFFSSQTASSSTPSESQRLKMSVKQFVEDSITSNKVVIFSKTWCPYCKKVKTLFAEKFPDVQPAIYELDEREEDGSAIQDYLYQKTGQRTVPSVFVGATHIGGNDDTQASFKQGELQKLITA
ncbi:glutaredoxin [Pholiota conissans]|uniref:glutathione peroxidase n=1 Tax=Pholiota conissans TaxID=109636 RepID=A0A9P5YXK6_9AGAR|nr:glutaredoxin [Pholiota conissans]